MYSILLAASLQILSLTAPHRPLVVASEQASHWFEEGKAALAAKKPDEAITLFNRVLEVEPKNAVATKAIGDAYLAKENPGMAMVYYDTAARIDPRYVAAFEGTVIAYSKKKGASNDMLVWYMQKAARAGSVAVQKNLKEAGYTWEEKDEKVAQGPKAPPLIEAAFKGDVALVKSLLAGGAKVDEKLPDGATALSQAASRGHAEVAALLLEKGAQIEAPMGDEHYTPLMAAAMMGQPKVVALLVDKGANLDARSTKGSTPLAFAALFGANAGEREKEYVEVVRLLVNKGADVNLKDANGGSALQIARTFKKQQMVDIMLKAGAH